MTTTACNQCWRCLEDLGQNKVWETNLCSSAATLIKNGDGHTHLLLTQKGELIMDVKSRVSLGSRDHEKWGATSHREREQKTVDVRPQIVVPKV